MYVAVPNLYMIEEGHWKLGRQFAVLTQTMFCFSVLTTMSMLITYVVRIRGKMGYLFFENINLLNKMNEGLIVVDESDRSLKFANIPAVQLMKYHSATEKQDNEPDSST